MVNQKSQLSVKEKGLKVQTSCLWTMTIRLDWTGLHPSITAYSMYSTVHSPQSTRTDCYRLDDASPACRMGYLKHLADWSPSVASTAGNACLLKVRGFAEGQMSNTLYKDILYQESASGAIGKELPSTKSKSLSRAAALDKDALSKLGPLGHSGHSSQTLPRDSR
jgi:hypothetical protein